MIKVERQSEDEHIEELINRFKKKVKSAGILEELKRREFYEKPSVRKRRKAMAARRRLLKKLRKYEKQQH